ncbi:hypothetical protein V7087_03695 [Neobacillus niacini]
MTKIQLMKGLDNIWYHYKTYIIVGILVLAALVPMAAGQFIQGSLVYR